MSNYVPIYMDYGASKPIDPRVLEEMKPYYLEKYGNPASFHSMGFEALQAMNISREKVANLINAHPQEIVFTSSATEASNLALLGSASRYNKKGNKVVISAIEHISTINISKELKRQGFTVETCPVGKTGILDLNELEKIVDDKTILLSIMIANGEIGTIQPIKEAIKIAKEHDALFHSDATAAIGQINVNVNKLGLDLMSISSNDMYGPKGMGALYMRNGIRVKPQIIGGGQEKGLRSGTENIPGIIGMGKAAEITIQEMDDESKRLKKLRDNLIHGLLNISESHLNGHPTKRLPNNANIRFSYIEGEALLMSLDELSIMASSGSACAAKTLEPSHTLLACGLKHEEAHGSLVFTLGKNNNPKQVEYIINQLYKIVERLRAMSPLTPKELK
jgi:cysteine desulfurase